MADRDIRGAPVEFETPRKSAQGQITDGVISGAMPSSTVGRIVARAVIAVGAVLVSVWSPFARTASAQAPIVINNIWAGGYNLSSPPGLFAGHIAFSVEVTSVNPVAAVTATFAGRIVPLQQGTFYWVGDDMATASLPFGPTPIEIRATDVLGNSVATLISRIHDNPPAIQILAPEPDVLVRSLVRVHATCTDDGGPCQMALESVTGVTGTNEINQTVSLAEPWSYSGGHSLRVRATDSQGQASVEWRDVWVEPSPRLSLVASYPGVIQDIDTSRALVFTKESPRRALIVDRLTGVAQPIFTEQPQSFLQEGQLTPSGALLAASVNNIVAQLYEWTPAALVTLGRVVDLDHFVGKMRVEGAWALFSRERETEEGYRVYDLVRRDLRSGLEVVLLGGTINPSWTSDVAANGDVVFKRPNGFRHDLVRYRQGVFEPLTVAASHIDHARTDGTLVVAAVSFGSQGWSCRAFTPTGEEVIAQHQSGFGSDIRVQEGWAACRMPFSPFQVWTRSSSGARQAITLQPSAVIDAIGGDGSLIYSQSVGSSGAVRRYLRRGDIAPIDVGSATWRVQRLDGIWYVIAGPHLFRIVGPENLLSEGATGSFFDQQIALLNPSGELAGVHTHYLKEGGEPAQYHRFVQPRSRLTISVDDEPDMASASASTVVESSTPLVVERTMTWDARGYGGHSGSAVDGARQRWLFAEGAQGYFDTFILLVNNAFGSATVRLTFLVEHGGTVIRTVTMAPRSRVTVHAGAIPELVNRSFATVVDASAPIGAERAMYFGASPVWTGGHGSPGVSEPSTRWFHAEGATGTVFDTFLLLANPGTEAANVVVTFLTAGGTTVTRQVTLPALSRRTINPENVDGRLANTSFATAVQSDVPIVSERAMYWSTTGGGWQEAHNSFGVTTTGTKWGTADGRAGGPRGYQTYVLVANTSTTATARLLATFMRTGGAAVTRTFDLGPSRRLNIDCSQIPELANSEFGVVVESTNAVPVVVERATYWNADGILWAGGSNVTATPVP